MSECSDLLLRLAREAGIEIPEAEAEELIAEFERQLRRRSSRSERDVNIAFEIAIERTRDLRLAARQAKRTAIISKVREADLIRRIKGYDGNLVDGYAAVQVGLSNMKRGTRDNVSSNGKALELELLDSFLKQAERAGDGIEGIMRKGTLDEEVTRYAYDRSADVSPQAKKIHEVVYKFNNAVRERKNRAGAYIGELDEFITTQMHDMTLIAKAGRETWKTDIKNMLDRRRTFGRLNDAEIEEYLDDLYKRFSLGKHYLSDFEEGEPIGAATTANLAKLASQKRTLHFLNGEKAFEYAQKYTTGNIWEKTANKIRNDARTIALMEVYGPNPRNMHNKIMKRLKATPDGISGFKEKDLNGRFDLLNGTLDMPAHVTLGQFGFFTRAVENMAKLGGAVLSALPDIAFKGATLNRRTDIGFFGSYIRAFNGIINTMPKADQKFFGEMTSIYTEVAMGDLHARAGAIDSMPGMMSRLQEKYFRWNLLQGWTMRHKKGLVAAFSYDLARYRNIDFDALPANTKRNLELYNFTRQEWSLMRHMETEVPETGNHLITSGAVNDIADEFIDPIVAAFRGSLDVSIVTPDMRQAFKDNLIKKINTMFSDFADEGVVTPGGRERSLMTLNQQKGTILGEFMRFIGQFKSFPITVITKQIAPQYYAGGGGAKGVASLIPVLIMTTALGYVSGAAKDVVRGRVPKDITDPRTFIDAMLRGGGLGIFGDYIFNEYNRYGRSLQETFMGPAAGTFNDALGLLYGSIYDLVEDKDTVDGADFIRFVKSVTPGANLFYTETAFNYLFLYGLMEHFDPGFLRKMERKQRKEFEQEFWLPPSTTATQF